MTRISILLVDDNEDLLEIMRAGLTDHGYDVKCAKNAQAALDEARNLQKVDLLITDLIMPGKLRSIDMASEVKKLFPDLKVIYASGYLGAEKWLFTPVEKLDRLIEKPFSIEQLNSLVIKMFTSTEC